MESVWVGGGRPICRPISFNNGHWGNIRLEWTTWLDQAVEPLLDIYCRMGRQTIFWLLGCWNTFMYFHVLLGEHLLGLYLWADQTTAREQRWKFQVQVIISTSGRGPLSRPSLKGLDISSDWGIPWHPRGAIIPVSTCNHFEQNLDKKKTGAWLKHVTRSVMTLIWNIKRK